MGCKEWAKQDHDAHFGGYGWVTAGTLLADGLCIGIDYQRDVVPFKGNTTVYNTIEIPKVREISLSEGTVSVDFQLTMRWLDDNIKTQFASDQNNSGSIVLSRASLDKIWNPDLYILDIVEPQAELKPSLKRSSALTTQPVSYTHLTLPTILLV